MDKYTLGLIIQLAACIALAAGLFWAGNTVKVLFLSGVVAWFVGGYFKTPRRS